LITADHAKKEKTFAWIAALIFPVCSAILRTMLRYLIIMVGIAWAFLLLFSWSGPQETSAQLPPASDTRSAS